MTDPAIGLGQIVATDPSFDLVAFLNRSGDSMTAVKSALQKRDLEDVAELVSADIYDRLRTEVEGLLDRGAFDNDDGLIVSKATVVAADHSAAGDQITVLFQAGPSQYSVASIEDPDAPSEMPISEYWTFSRPPVSSQPRSRPECPTCGAPVDIDTGRICRYCKTLLPAPQQHAGWTVVAIAPAAQNP